MKILKLVVLETNENSSFSLDLELPKTNPVGLSTETLVVAEQDFEQFETGVREMGDALRELRRSKAS